MWRYGQDLSPVWGSGTKGSIETRILSGSGRSGVGDIIEFASGIFAYNWRAVTGPGAFNDPDFLVVGLWLALCVSVSLSLSALSLSPRPLTS